MTVTRPHVCEIALGRAEADDHGNVLIAAVNMPFTPDEALELAAEITAAATTAAGYRAEQTGASS